MEPRDAETRVYERGTTAGKGKQMCGGEEGRNEGRNGRKYRRVEVMEGREAVR